MRMLREARGCEQKSILLGQICRDANETTWLGLMMLYEESLGKNVNEESRINKIS